MSLESLAREKQSSVQFQASTPELRLQMAFEAAKAIVFRYIPKGYSLSVEDALQAQDLLGNQIKKNEAFLIKYLESGTDLDEALSLTLTTQQMRQWILSKYTLASAGIGSYFSGYMKDAVDRGLVTREQYEDGLNERMLVFGDIVRWDQDGHIGSLIAGENYISEMAQRGVQAGAIDPSSEKVTKIVIGTNGKKLKTTSDPVSLGVNPLVVVGGANPVVVIGVVAAVVAISLVAGLVYCWVSSDRLATSARLTQDRCEEANKYGYQDTITWCNKAVSDLGNTGGFLDTILGAGAGKEIGRWLVIGGIGYLAITFLPSIMASIGRAQDVAEERRLRKAARGQ